MNGDEADVHKNSCQAQLFENPAAWCDVRPVLTRRSLPCVSRWIVDSIASSAAATIFFAVVVRVAGRLTEDAIADRTRAVEGECQECQDCPCNINDRDVWFHARTLHNVAIAIEQLPGRFCVMCYSCIECRSIARCEVISR